MSDTPPLKIGDRIRILEDGYHFADVERGDVLTVQGVDSGGLWTNSPSLADPDAEWYFDREGEGTGWERT